MKILIPIYTGLGNSILIIPMIRTIKKVYPQSIIDVIGDNVSGNYELFKEDKDVRKVFSEFPSKEKYDIFLGIFLGNIDKIVFKVLFQSKVKKILHLNRYVKYSFKRSLYNKILKHIFRVKFVDFKFSHEIYNNLLILKEIGIKESDFIFEPNIHLNIVNKGLKSCDKYKLPKNYLIVYPGSTNNCNTPKRWFIEYWKELINLLKDYKIVLLGNNTEIELGNYLSDKNTINLIGKTNIQEVIGIIKKSKIVIGVDSGIGHISGALNIKTLILWGPTSFTKSHQVGRNTKFLSLSLPCAPCTAPFFGLKFEEEASKSCPYDFKCMKDMSANMIYQEIKNMF